jgi:hypothetical protein
VCKLGLGESQLAAAFGDSLCDLREEPPLVCVGEALAQPLNAAYSFSRDLTHIANVVCIATMRLRRAYWTRVARDAAVVLYLAITLTVSYVLWGPYDGVEPAWAFSWWMFGTLLCLHVVVGSVIGRWWAVALPVVWAFGSAWAEGYDTPVTTVILFQSAFFWIPALAIGVVLRKLMTPKPHLAR